MKLHCTTPVSQSVEVAAACLLGTSAALAVGQQAVALNAVMVFTTDQHHQLCALTPLSCSVSSVVCFALEFCSCVSSYRNSSALQEAARFQ